MFNMGDHIMESDIFRAGVVPGSPTTEDEVKMLLCYILSNIKQPMSFSQLYEALSENNMVNYFELVHVLDKLAELGHLTAVELDAKPEYYTTTDLGDEAGREFERTLPLSVRDKALAASQRALRRECRLNEVKIIKTPCGKGFMLELSIPDLGGELISIKLFSSTKEDCEQISKRFLNAPLTVYRGVMALLTGDEAVLGEIFSKEEPLF